jgi:hypothetical protein
MMGPWLLIPVLVLTVIAFLLLYRAPNITQHPALHKTPLEVCILGPAVLREN